MNVGNALLIAWMPIFGLIGWYSSRRITEERFAKGLLTPLAAFLCALGIAYFYGTRYAITSGVEPVTVAFMFLFVVALPTFLLELLLLMFIRIKRDEFLKKENAPPEHVYGQFNWKRRGEPK